MKFTSLFSLALATVLLSACGSDKTTPESTTATTATTEATPTAAPAAAKPDKMGAMDMPAAGPAATGSLTGAMAKMMQQTNAGQPIGNTDHDFTHMMMAHHQGAVDMSAVVLREGKDATIKAMAQKISADQQREIAALEKAATRLDGAAKNYSPKDPNDKFQQRMDQSMKPMMMPMTPSGDVDRDYVMMMVPHHQSAVEMAQAEVAMGKDAAVKKMAQGMIEAQNKEIAQFNAWLKQHGGIGKM